MYSAHSLGPQKTVRAALPPVLDEGVVVSRVCLTAVHDDADELVVDLVAAERHSSRVEHLERRRRSEQRSSDSGFEMTDMNSTESRLVCSLIFARRQFPQPSSSKRFSSSSVTCGWRGEPHRGPEILKQEGFARMPRNTRFCAVRIANTFAALNITLVA